MRVLIVEDDPLFGSALHKSLGRAGFAADWMRSGSDLVRALATAVYDCILLDLNLPDLSGEDALRDVHASEAAPPLIVITARGGVTDRIRMLDMGADDYLTKPVDLDEVAARVRALVRRTQAKPAAPVLGYGALLLDTDRRRATWHGDPVAVTSKEFALLETLVRSRGEVLSRGRLGQTLYGLGDETSSNTIEVYIHHLRRKFGPQLVRTVRGAGYRLGTAEASRA